MNNRIIKAVCRSSPLSLLQVKELFALYPKIKYELTSLHSFGDKNKHISLMDTIDADFFTRELDWAVLNAEADIAVHSAKDLPYPMSSELELYCLTEAADKTDALVDKNNRKLSELPAGSKVGTSSQNRRDELLALRPDLTIVAIRGSIEERIALIKKGDIDALIVASCALRRLGLDHLIAEVLPFKTHPLQGNLAVVGRKGNEELKSLFAAHDIRRKYGRVTLVGFGPGNPDLLTIGGDKALSKADFIFHDDLIDKAFPNKYRATKVYVGKRNGKHSHHQGEINEQLYMAAISGRNVVRLKGGDPMILAHGREEIDFLKSRFVEVTVIPGISSGIALASYTHIPLTHRGISSSVAFVSGHPSNKRNIPAADTLVYYMAGENISDIAKELIASGRDACTPAAWVYGVALPGQKTFFTTLKELRFSVMKHSVPVLVIIGEVVAFENKTVQNILATGTTCSEYRGQGNVTHTPLIKVEKNRDGSRLLKQAAGPYQWIVFTSRYGVRFFFEILNDAQLDLRSFGATKIASVGKTTTLELKKHHICRPGAASAADMVQPLPFYPDVESETETAEGLIRYFETICLSNSKVLLPRSNKGLPYLPEALARMGNQVTDLPVYNNLVNESAEKVDLTQFQKIMFSSPSGVEAFKKIYGALPEGIPLVARGKTTENRIKRELALRTKS
jgi:uroporphyrinogen III methyltransferase/synthase